MKIELWPVWVPGWILGLMVFITAGLWRNFIAGYKRHTTDWTDYHPDFDD
jgi:hypothetical protein